jgi:tyrosine-protein kinase Etk/Wzc
MNDVLQQDLNGMEIRPKVTTPMEMVLRYLPFLPWVLASVFICLTIAFIKLRYSPNIFNVTSTILVKDENSSSVGGKFEEMLFAQPNKNIDDEIQMIRARSMAKRVVASLNLDVQYFLEGNIRASHIYAKESPFVLNKLLIRNPTSPFSLTIKFLNENQFVLTEGGQALNFEQSFETMEGKFSLSRSVNSFYTYSGNRFIITYAPTEMRAAELAGRLTASQSGESNNIMMLVYETEDTKDGIDVVNQWMKEYQQAGLEEKRQTAVNALRFIDDQMDTVRLELGGVEKNLQGYREKNRLFNPEQQSINVFSTVTELDKEITTQGVRLQVVDNLIAYISDTRSGFRKVGSTLGIEEPSLIAQIGEFNSLQVQRETLLMTTTASNPMVINLGTTIENLRLDILQNLRNVRQAYQLSLNNLGFRSREAGKEISTIPAKEKQLLDITRRQKILEELYSFLLQKKLETSIGSASTISNVRVIEPATASQVPVKPDRPGTFLTALFLGLLIPFVIIFLMEYLNDKVNSREDIQLVTSASIIGEVGHSDEKDTLVVTRTSRRFIAEQFRIIRSNLQYVLPKQEKIVILVSSTSSGEGKSFISANLGAVMALTGKKTAILEFDIRKPKIMSSLSLPSKSGISNYIIGKASFEDLPVPVPNVENLFVIPCGPVPPNPAELLLEDRMGDLMREAREQFDVVIIDSAPVGLVSDAVALGKYADASMYVIRHGYTHKKQLQLLNEVFTSKRLPRLSLVINDIKAGGYGKYYGYGGYGYTGYGYGSEYFEEKKSKGFFGQGLRGFIERIRERG